MKKSTILLLFAVTAIVLSSFKISKTSNVSDATYKVVYGWEYYSGKSRPFISNVFYVDCRLQFDGMVKNQISRFYGANYKASRTTDYLQASTVYSCKTKAEAEARRNKMISDAKINWDPLIINGFSVACEDD